MYNQLNKSKCDMLCCAVSIAYTVYIIINMVFVCGKALKKRTNSEFNTIIAKMNALLYECAFSFSFIHPVCLI